MHNLFFLRLIRQRRAAQRSSSLFQVLQCFRHPFDILQSQLSLNNLHITDRIDVALYVDDLSIVERANDLEDTVNSADVG